MTPRWALRRRAAIVVLLPALLSGVWLSLWERATRGDCCDDVCVCATLCASRVSCHGDHGGSGTRLSRACSKGEEAALRAPAPGVLTDDGENVILARAGAVTPIPDPSPVPRRVPPEPHPPPPARA